MRKKGADLPQNRIVIKRGRVQSLEKWGGEDLEPHLSLLIERELNGEFSCDLTSSETEGGTQMGSLPEVLRDLPEDFQRPIIAGFIMEKGEPTKKSLEDIGLSGYEICFK